MTDNSWALHREHIRAGRCTVLQDPDPRVVAQRLGGKPAPFGRRDGVELTGKHSNPIAFENQHIACLCGRLAQFGLNIAIHDPLKNLQRHCAVGQHYVVELFDVKRLPR